MTEAVLTINAGSSSLKFALFDTNMNVIARGDIDGIGHDGKTHNTALHECMRTLDASAPHVRLIGAGHRVVHGGERFVEPVRINPDIRRALAELIPLAPLHQPHNLAAIDALARARPDLPQVACFDTAFHASQAWEATAFALPRELTGLGIRRYGFHGLSYEFIASTLNDHLGERADGRVIVAHLGSGASMCAMKQRRSVATTMGFTALEGLPMGTRCGTLDPGVILYLLERGWTEKEISDTLWHHSGLLGMSGVSDDVRALLASEEPAAARALRFFAYRVARELGSLAISLGGIDALVFTAGIGEHASSIRAQVCEQARFLGITLNAEANERNATRISDTASRVTVCVLPTDEEIVTARHTLRLLTGEAP